MKGSSPLLCIVILISFSFSTCFVLPGLPTTLSVSKTSHPQLFSEPIGSSSGEYSDAADLDTAKKSSEQTRDITSSREDNAVREQNSSEQGDDIHEKPLIDVSKVDWRLYRAQLVAKERGVTLNPEKWAFETPSIEQGTVLLANPTLQGEFWQSVIFLTDHDDRYGSNGYILNRPTAMKVGDIPGIPKNIRKAFEFCPIYYGGPVDLDYISVIHNYSDIKESREVVSGIYIGGLNHLAELVTKREIDPYAVRFTQGRAAWQPRQLAGELKNALWFPASVSKNMITDHCILLPVPLWCQILQMMGGDYELIAKKFRKT